MQALAKLRYNDDNLKDLELASDDRNDWDNY